MSNASLVDDSLEATADPHLTDAELRTVKESIKVVVEIYNSEGRIPRAPGTTRKNLKNRLLLTMGQMKEYKVPATRWRKDKGRKVYLQVLKACPHLFLAFVTAVAPTVCHRLKDDNIQTLIQDNEVEPLRLRLNADAKEFLYSVATEGKFANDQRYLGLLSSLFPKGERPDCEGAGPLESSAVHHDTEDSATFSSEKHPSMEAEKQDQRASKRPRLSATDTPGPVHSSNHSSDTNQSNSSHQPKDRPLWNGNDTPFLELQTVSFSNFLMKVHGEGGLLRLVLPRDGSPLPWIEVRTKEGDIITTMEVSLKSSTELIKFVRRESGDMYPK